MQAVGMMLLLSIVFFGLVNLAPGGPLAGYGRARRIPAAEIARLKSQLGLDKPVAVQYVVWLVGNDWMQVDTDSNGVADDRGTRRGILRGDFGYSFRNRKPVLEEIWARLPNTMLLTGVTLFVALALAIPIGVVSALRQYSKFDITVTTFAFAGQALPDFWLGLILIIVFYVWLRNPITGGPLLPSGGIYTIGAPFSISDRLAHLAMPVAAGALGWLAWYSRFLRSSMLDVIHQDYLRTARAKGLPERLVLFRHAMRNALIPLVTILGLDLPYLVSGAVFIEMIFAWPGMGLLYYQAALQRDYPVLMALLVLGAGFIIVSNLLADIVYAVLDPRIHYT